MEYYKNIKSSIKSLKVKMQHMEKDLKDVWDVVSKGHIEQLILGQGRETSQITPKLHAKKMISLAEQGNEEGRTCIFGGKIT